MFLQADRRVQCNTRVTDAFNKHTHRLMVHRFVILLLTVVMWDNGIRQLSCYCANRKSEGEEEGESESE